LTAIKTAAAARNTFWSVEAGISTSPRRLLSDGPFDAASLFAMFADVRRIRADAHTGATGKPLRGRNLAVLLGPDAERDGSTLHRAATDLGARVAEIRFSASATSANDELGVLARMLGRMYDAIDCGALAPQTCGRIELEAGVPVFDGLGLEEHPAQGLADLMTLCECHSPQSPGATLLFVGDSRTRRGHAFVSAAGEMGFDVRMRDDRGEASADEALFVIDARCAPRWLLRCAGRPVDEARRSENHRCLIQSVLLETIARA
jgi:ornithine carbamoyltransferase